MIPKVQSAKDVHFVSRMIDAVALESRYVMLLLSFYMMSNMRHYRREKIRLIASVESALGIMNIQEIATSDPRMDALIVCEMHDSLLYYMAAHILFFI